MKLNHVNLTVSDVHAAEAFLERYFGLRQRADTGPISVLEDDDGLVVTLMNTGETDSVAYPNTFHVGFFVESEDTIDELHRRLAQDGFEVMDTKVRHNRYGFYVEAPGGFTIEVGA